MYIKWMLKHSLCRPPINICDEVDLIASEVCQQWNKSSSETALNNSKPVILNLLCLL